MKAFSLDLGYLNLIDVVPFVNCERQWATDLTTQTAERKFPNPPHDAVNMGSGLSEPSKLDLLTDAASVSSVFEICV